MWREAKGRWVIIMKVSLDDFIVREIKEDRF